MVSAYFVTNSTLLDGGKKSVFAFSAVNELWINDFLPSLPIARPLYAKRVDSTLSGLYHKTVRQRYGAGNDGALVGCRSGGDGAIVIPDDVHVALGISHHYTRFLDKRRGQFQSVEQVLLPYIGAILFIVGHDSALVLAYVKIMIIHGQACIAGYIACPDLVAC